MNARRIARIVAGSALWFLATILSAQDAAPAMTLSDAGIEISGLRPGASVVVFGVTHSHIALVNHIEPVAEVVVDSDKDGRAFLPRATPIPPAAVFVAVDLRSGRVVAATGDGTDVRGIDERMRGLKKGRSGKVDQFAIDRSLVELLYVHGGRAWVWSVADGGSDDDDGTSGADGKVTAIGARARALHDDKASFDEFTPGGTLIAIDPARLGVAVVHVDKTLLDGVR